MLTMIFTSIFHLTDSILRGICSLLLGYTFPQKSLELVLIETVLLTALTAWGLYKLFHRDPLPPAADYIIETRNVNCQPPAGPAPYMPGILKAIALLAVLSMAASVF